MYKKLLASIIIFMLIANSSFTISAISYAKGSAPSTSSRSGSFSTRDSTFHNAPPAQNNSGSTSSGGFSGGSSGKVTSPSTGSNGFSGGASNKSNVPNSSSTGSTKNGTTYNSGYQRPTNVADGSRVNPNNGRAYFGGSTYYNAPPNGYRTSHFWPVVGAFAAGTMLGSMIHPWGGYYPMAGGGYVHQPFSLLTIIMDIVVLLIVIWLIVLVVSLFTRRRSY
jgi:hypothetical protein